MRGFLGLLELPSVREAYEEWCKTHDMNWWTGFVEGRRREKVEAILRIVVLRFYPVPNDFKGLPAAITDDDRLTRLLDTAATCPDLEAFRVALVGN